MIYRESLSKKLNSWKTATKFKNDEILDTSIIKGMETLDRNHNKAS